MEGDISNMKKFAKFVFGTAALAGTTCGVLYFMQKVLGWDIFNKNKEDDDDFDDGVDDFDDDIDDMGDDEEDREYVTLDMENEDTEEKKKPETTDTTGTEEAAEEKPEEAPAEEAPATGTTEETPAAAE